MKFDNLPILHLIQCAEEISVFEVKDVTADCFPGTIGDVVRD